MKRLLFLISILFSCCLGGCATGLPAYHRPESLYLQRSPYSSIHVEVDIVAGCNPGTEPLEHLREFLELHCDKPGGVSLVKKPYIPRDDAQGVTPSQLALRNMTGPSQQSSAYIYVLFYDTGLIDNQQRFPYVLSDYPNAIFVDQANLGRSDLNTHVLLHEAGHVLGMLKRPGRRKGSHCSDPTCLMYHRVSPSSVRQNHELALAVDPNAGPLDVHNFCPRCLEELARSRRAPAGNMRWQGPALIRDEGQYWVAMLPDFIGVFIEPQTTFGIDALLLAARRDVTGDKKATVVFMPPVMSNSARAALRAAMRDPSSRVRKSARSAASY